MEFTAKDVMRLREETGAPMMDCKAALTEANGDFERAKEILKEKGKAATAKRAGRETGHGVVAFSVSSDHKRIGAVVLESETDFVARNEEFVALAQELAEIFLHNEPGENPTTVKHGDKSVQELIEAVVNKVRENVKIGTALHLSTEDQFATYVHHDRTKGAIVEISGDAEHGRQAARDVAIQVVALSPEVLRKEDLSQDMLAKELEIQTKRAIDEGKPEAIAKNIAQGRVNKEYIKQAVLLEQDFYKDPSMTVATFVKQTGGGGEIKSYRNLRAG
jgi:elongation factor Ts